MGATGKFNQGDKHGGNDNVVTPQTIIQSLGGAHTFDLDPCYGHPRPWPTANEMWSLDDGEDGLTREWHGRVWLNPPYSQAARWIERMALHRNGIVLVFGRTETEWFQVNVFPVATGILFLKGRLSFHSPDGDYVRTRSGKVSNAGAPSVLISYDPDGSAPTNLYRMSMALRDGWYQGYLNRLWGQKA